MAGNWEEILEKMKADFSKMDPNIVETNLALTRAALSSWKEWVEVVSHYTEQTATGMVEISRDPSRINEKYFRGNRVGFTSLAPVRHRPIGDRTKRSCRISHLPPQSKSR